MHVLETRPTTEEFPAGKGKVLCRDDAAGDPASLGIACLLYGIAEKEDVKAGRKAEEQMARTNGVGMLEAAELEASFLENDACRVCPSLPTQENEGLLTLSVLQSKDGAISHRLSHLHCGPTLCIWFPLSSWVLKNLISA